MAHTPDAPIIEGKTKQVFATRDPDVVRIVSKDDITAFDNPDVTQLLPNKGIYATETTCNIFTMMREAGLPVAFIERSGDNEFTAPVCQMVPLEAIARRIVGGPSSYRKRHPELGSADIRFGRLMTEFFLKTSGGRLEINGQVLVEGLDPLKGEEDPFIANFEEGEWRLVHPKKPAGDPTADLGRTILRSAIIGEQQSAQVDSLLRQGTLAVEALWATLGFVLYDIKLEFALDVDGNLIIGDVVDADSWRLQGPNGREYSKQVFRDQASVNGVDLGLLSELYAEIAELTRRFRIPRQALVLWTGSDKDEFPKTTNLPGVALETVVLSGHKKTQVALAKLDELHGKYPEGGVIITKVGRSNGLGPILQSHTTWPVIAVPATAKDFPQDVWSSLRMPSALPMATILEDGNAVGAALNILAQRNPALLAKLRFGVEETDVP